MDHDTAAAGNVVNLSPVGFRKTARDLLAYHRAYTPPKFSLAPYFLCCRAIELALKARYLDRHPGQPAVKQRFGHDLTRVLDAVLPLEPPLTTSERRLLEVASRVYGKGEKAFEYMHPADAATAFSRFPDLADLSRLAERLVNSSGGA